MTIHGKQIIGRSQSAEGTETFRAVNPAAGRTLSPAFYSATDAEIARAAALAEVAGHELVSKTGRQKAAFLESIAERIMGLGDDLIDRAHVETALPESRLQAERAKTVDQIRLFADLIREGSWVDARIESTVPNRTPTPKPDMRRMLRPIGPVAVFCASNFPLFLSVAGNDTSSALAAGNPVIVKGHHAHPGTANLVAQAVQRAAAGADMPDGTFSMLYGPSREAGITLVRHPAVKAVGFTGSQSGGRALFDAAAARPEPIPFYAEMGSVNPVFILPGALRERADQIADGLSRSVTVGVGQFCTNPGVIVLLEGDAAESFLRKVVALLGQVPAAAMLHDRIHQAYVSGIRSLLTRDGVRPAAGVETAAEDGRTVRPAVFRTDARTFAADPDLREEVFGPSTIAVTCADRQELLTVARSFCGQLSATLHASASELEDYRDLAAELTARVGRLVFDGFPTGLEVCSATQHGGPYPATTHSHFTSVGTAAILRFVRPICYQDCPRALLPPELQDGNPLGIWRMVDGRLGKQ